jgi:biopolymer transport protein TolQ
MLDVDEPGSGDLARSYDPGCWSRLVICSPFTSDSTIGIDVTSLFVSGSLPMVILTWGIVGAAALVWIIIVVKSRQVRRWRRAQARFERFVAETTDWEAARRRCETDRESIGAPVLLALFQAARYPEVLEAVAEREVERQHERTHGMMTALSSIGVTAPLLGLFGTVYGIIHAFLRIGAAKSASLAQVAPAIGEALITTAVGLFAAIPAIIAFNALSKQLEDLLAGVEAAARVWAGRVRVTTTAKREEA